VNRTLASAMVVAAVCAIGSAARADDTQFIKPPAGWTRDVAQASSLAAKANSVSHFGGASSLASTEVFVAPGTSATLFVTAVVGTVNDHRDAAARVEIDSFLGAPKRAQLSSPKISIAQTGTVLAPKTKQIESTVQWSDDETKTSTHARLVVAADDSTMVAITVECVVGTDAAQAVRDACTKTFTTIDPELDVNTRVALALAPEGTEPPPGPNATGPKPSLPPPSASSPSGRPPSTMSDGSRAPVPPIHLQQTETSRTTDKRPVYVGLGIVVLAAVFWWNRRRRERFEKEPNDDDN
jgi:hypothetical protein